MEIVEDALQGTDAPFTAFCPSDILNDIRSLRLFQGHVSELLKRHERGEDLRPGTMAEIAGALSKMSGVVPIDQTYSLAYWRAFEVAMPDHGLEDPDFRDQYEGAADEILSALRKKLSVPARRQR